MHPLATQFCLLAIAGVTIQHNAPGMLAYPRSDDAPSPQVGTNTSTSVPTMDVGQGIKLIDTAGSHALPGATRALRHVVLSTSFDTRLSRLTVEEGQLVRAGEIVAVLDDRVAQATLRVAELEAANEALIARAQARVDEAEANLEHVGRAQAAGAANKDEVDDAQTAVAVAEADLRLAQHEHDRAGLELELARARVEEHLARAPFDAVVLRVKAEPGEVLSPGDPIAELATEGQICVDLYLPSSAAASIKKGETYSLHVGEPLDVTLPASVRYVERRIDPTSKTQRVVFEFNAEFRRLSIGMLVKPASRMPTSADIATASESRSGGSLATLSQHSHEGP